MIKTFTPDDLLRFLYQDTTAEESVEIQIALLTDERLQHEWQQLQQDMELLEPVLTLEPSAAATDKIMHWAGAMNMAAFRN